MKNSDMDNLQNLLIGKWAVIWFNISLFLSLSLAPTCLVHKQNFLGEMCVKLTFEGENSGIICIT